jgi:hypothetical protein
VERIDGRYRQSKWMMEMDNWYGYWDKTVGIYNEIGQPEQIMGLES